MTRYVLITVLLLGCKRAAPVEDHPVARSGSSGSAVIAPPPAIDAAVAAAPAWKLASQPVELTCGDSLLTLPAAVPPSKPPVDAALQPRAGLSVCKDQASVAAVCTCLADSIARWSTDLGLSPRGECTPDKEADANARLVKIRSLPEATDTTSPGEAYVLVARRGATWSAIEIVEVAVEIDLSETPKASERATISRFEAKPITDGTMYWIESRTDSQDKSMGELEISGEAQGLICRTTPTSAGCYPPLALGSWEYTFTVAKAGAADACAIQKIATFGVTLDASSANVQLLQGTQTDAIAGTYKL